MRRDDTDIFADKNEGKVLIMDNLFAQTNASHLLIPLMDMAKKSNTQFICLTGLGGESIYNRAESDRCKSERRYAVSESRTQKRERTG